MSDDKRQRLEARIEARRSRKRGLEVEFEGELTLMLVDDEPPNLEALERLLKSSFEIATFTSGEAALDAFSRQPADVVLIDIMLPGIAGFEVCRNIRRLGDVPIVMVTARSDSHDVVAGLEAGADDFLRKPFDPKELSARIRALLRRVRSDDVQPNRIHVGDLEVLPE